MEFRNLSTQPKSTIMKKWIIGSLVGAILVFAWQFLSWTVLGIHDKAAVYHPAQDTILAMLSSTLKEDGTYMLPTTKPGASMDEMNALGEQMKGKPWAVVTYKTSYDNSMSTPMIRGFIIDLILVILLISILTRGLTPGFLSIVTGAIAVGIFSFLWGPYMQYNWFQTPWDSIQGHLIDAIVAWGLCGLWLGWWLRRGISREPAVVSS